jgi:hypothetical protein
LIIIMANVGNHRLLGFDAGDWSMLFGGFLISALVALLG